MNKACLPIRLPTSKSPGLPSVHPAGLPVPWPSCPVGSKGRSRPKTRRSTPPPGASPATSSPPRPSPERGGKCSGEKREMACVLTPEAYPTTPGRCGDGRAVPLPNPGDRPHHRQQVPRGVPVGLRRSRPFLLHRPLYRHRIIPLSSSRNAFILSSRLSFRMVAFLLQKGFLGGKAIIPLLEHTCRDTTDTPCSISSSKSLRTLTTRSLLTKQLTGKALGH